MRTGRTLRAIRLLLLALILAVAGAEGWLVLQVVRGARQEEALRHQLVAERLFDELEEELGALVEVEERRSFLEYRYLYVPEGNVKGATLVRSPLAAPVQDKRIAGYFQVEPDKTVTNPEVPRANELDLAQDNWGEEVQVAPDDGLLALNALVSSVDWEAQEQAQQVVLPEEGQGLLSKRGGSLQSFNRAAEDRQGQRAIQQVQTADLNLDAYRTKDGLSLSEEEAEPPAQQPPAAPEPPPADPEPEVEAAPFVAAIATRLPPRAQPEDTEPVEVQVTPMEGRLEEGVLLLSRTVTVGDESWRQGVGLHADELAAELERAVLADTHLAPWVDLAWQGEPPPLRDYAHDHTFAPPFESLHATASLGRIPGERATSGPLLWLVGLVGLLTLAGAVALYRMVAAEVEFAQRRSDFVAAVSHELKSPLTAIRMYGEMLRDGMVPDEGRKHTYYATITSESERLTRLIANVLELSRLERGTRRAEVEAGDVGAVLDEVVEILGPHAGDRGFELQVHLDPDLPAVSYDRDALLQVLVNLVDNAIKFSAAAEDRRIELRATRADSGVALVVRDHGPGVPRKQLARVFQPFWRGERELTRRTKGTGIGLALVQGLVEDMGGAVTARNHPEGGFQVRILLDAV